MQQNLNEAFTSVLTSEQRLSRLEQVDRNLMKWKDDLPPELRPEQQVVFDSGAHIDIYLLHLDYFNLLQCIHWGLITRQPDIIDVGEIPRFRASDSICLGACLALVRTLNVLVNTFIICSRDHIY